MTTHQALEVLNPDKERQSLPIQRQAFAVLKSALKENKMESDDIEIKAWSIKETSGYDFMKVSDSTDAGGELTITKERKVSGEIE